MNTYAIVLVLEDLEEYEGDPMDWNWSELLDTPASGYVAGCTKIAAHPTPAQVMWLGQNVDEFISNLKEECGE